MRKISFDSNGPSNVDLVSSLYEQVKAAVMMEDSTSEAQPLGLRRLLSEARSTMATVVELQVISSAPEAEVRSAMRRALDWFQVVEQAATRFDERSEVMQLIAHVGEACPVSPVVFQAVSFALNLARATGGAFDPAVGGRLEALCFNRNYRTGEIVDSGLGA